MVSKATMGTHLQDPPLHGGRIAGVQLLTVMLDQSAEFSIGEPQLWEPRVEPPAY